MRNERSVNFGIGVPIGRNLHLSLLYGLKELIDFDSEFPIYAPLECAVADPVNGFPFGLKYEKIRIHFSEKWKEADRFPGSIRV